MSIISIFKSLLGALSKTFENSENIDDLYCAYGGKMAAGHAQIPGTQSAKALKVTSCIFVCFHVEWSSQT